MSSCLGCFFLGAKVGEEVGEEVEERMSQEAFYASHSQLQVCSPWYQWKEASLPFIVSSSKDCRLPHAFWLQHRPQITRLALVVAWAMDINTTQPPRAAGPWPHIAAQATHRNMAFGENTNHEHQHAP